MSKHGGRKILFARQFSYLGIKLLLHIFAINSIGHGQSQYVPHFGDQLLFPALLSNLVSEN